jgi:hypothetical protein
MKAIEIDPVERTIEETAVHCEARAIAERFASPPREVARFPNGDVLLASPIDAAEAFTVGGTKPIAGPALLVGRRKEFGEHAPSRTSLDVVRSMVRWTSVERKIVPASPVRPSKVRVVVMDPEIRTIDEMEMQATASALEALVGAAFMEYFRVPGGNIYGSQFLARAPSLWRKEDLVFPGRVVIVGVTDDYSHMFDTTIALDNLRKTVEFRSAGSDEWVRYSAASTSV